MEKDILLKIKNFLIKIYTSIAWLF
jgi:hypothetical protein